MEGKSAAYYGETNRTMMDRTHEHVELLRRKKEESILMEHWGEVHPQRKDPPKYKFQALTSHKSSLERQLKEALNIASSKEDFLLNRKSEFARNCIVTQSSEFDGKKWMDRKEESGRIQEEKERESPRGKRRRMTEEERQEVKEGPVSSHKELKERDRMFWERIGLAGRGFKEDRKKNVSSKRKDRSLEDCTASQRNGIREWLRIDNRK